MANVSIPPPSQSDWSRFDHESHPGINRIFQKVEQMGVRCKEVCGVKCSQQLSFLAPGENHCDAQLQVLLCRLVSLSGRVPMSLQAFGYICTWGQTCLCTYQLHEAINSFLFPFNKKVLNKYLPIETKESPRVRGFTSTKRWKSDFPLSLTQRIPCNYSRKLSILEKWVRLWK